jgi:hypothetical protein
MPRKGIAMEGFRWSVICLGIFTIIALSGRDVYALYHHVNDCTVCHYGGGEDSVDCKGSGNLMLIRDTITTPGSGPQDAVFGPYVSDVSPYGVCQVCHEISGDYATKY